MLILFGAWLVLVEALSVTRLGVLPHVPGALSYPDDPQAGVVYAIPTLQAGVTKTVTVVATSRPKADLITAALDVPLKLLGFSLAVLLVARGRGRFGFFSGLSLFGIFAMEGYAFSFAALADPWKSALGLANFVVCGVVLRYFIAEAAIALAGDAIRPWESAAVRVVTGAGSVLVGAALLGAGPPLAIGLLLQRVAVLAFALPLIRPTSHDRRVVSWVFWTTLIGFTGGTANLVLQLAHLPVPEYGALNFLFLVTAFGMAYVSLRYHVVDLSFVINRTLAYGSVLAALAALVALTEHLVVRFALGAVDSAVLEALVAVILGVSFKSIERRIEDVIDRVFFARKYAAASALRHLIHDCSYVDDTAKLAQLVCDETRRVIETARVTMYERSGDVLVPIASSPAPHVAIPVSCDDAAVVRMRSSHVAVQLGERASLLGSEGVAFPMMARGKLVGALCCGARAHGSGYDPDERSLLMRLAHEAGVSLLLLRAEGLADRIRKS